VTSETDATFDAIIVGAGPGGLQAAIHLARYNLRVLLFDGGPGRTRHAAEIENYLGLRTIAGTELIAVGLEQARAFGVSIEQAAVERVSGAEGRFEVEAAGSRHLARYLIAASGGAERYPTLKNFGRHFGRSYFTCVICDGYRTTGRKLLVSARSLAGVRLALAARRLFTPDVSFLAEGFAFPEDHRFLLEEQGITIYQGSPVELLGEERLEGVRLADGTAIPCEVVLGGHGFRLNDDYLSGFTLERDTAGFQIRTNAAGESSVRGLFVVGAQRAGHSQAVISAGQGAVAALEIVHRLVSF
jgi:thioredoxin reductase (NADPH)